MFGESRGPGSVRVKICGITSRQDAEDAVACGAEALGLNFFPGSKRYLDIESAKGWISQLPSIVTKVAVLVDPSWDEALRLADFPFIDSLQLHGNESPEFCRQLAERKIRFTKAIPVIDENSIRQSTHYSTETILLDSARPGEFGGTGQVFSWELGRRFVEDHPQFQVILAGGLTPENVAEAVRTVRPFGVDVTTGVELSPGRKDRVRMNAFIQAARGA
jgi:phosphoribosylanthranilate isomerase